MFRTKKGCQTALHLQHLSMSKGCSFPHVYRMTTIETSSYLKRLFQNNNPQSNLKTSQNIVVIAVSVVRLFSKLQGFHYQRNLVFPALLRSSLPTFRRSSSTAFRWFDNFNLSDWSLTFSLFCCSTWPFTSQKWGPPRMDHSIFQNESWLTKK